jgi:hypothetical protein
MKRTRTLVGTLALALATAGIVSSLDSPTSANPAFDVSGSLQVPDRPDRGHAWVEGVITNRATKKAVGDDEVTVEAYPAGVTDSDLVASSALYASPDGKTEHGFYRLWGLEPGNYRIKFIDSHGTYVDAIKMVTVGDREIQRLDQELKLSTATKASADDDVITSAEKGKVTVKVASAGVRPVGNVEIRLGRKRVGSDQVRASDKGRVTVTLPRLAVGSYSLRAYYLGSKSFGESTSRTVSLTVKKPRHHH